MELYRDLIELSLNEKCGLTIYLNGQTIAGIVTRIIETEAIEVRNQTFSRIIVRIDAIEAIAIG